MFLHYFLLPHIPASPNPTVTLFHLSSCQNTFNLMSQIAKLAFTLHQDSKPSSFPKSSHKNGKNRHSSQLVQNLLFCSWLKITGMTAPGWLLGWVVQWDGSFGNSQELNYLESCAVCPSFRKEEDKNALSHCTITTTQTKRMRKQTPWPVKQSVCWVWVQIQNTSKRLRRKGV